MKREYLYGALIATLIILVILFLFRPCAIGGECDFPCTYTTGPVNVTEDGMDSKDVCPPGCFIDKWWWDTEAQSVIVKCICCDCILVGGETPDCADYGLLGGIYHWLGWCEYR